MKTFMAFPICSLIFILLVSSVYFVKPHIKSIENSIYKWLVISNIIGLILEIMCYFAVDLVVKYQLISIVILKSYVVYIFLWSMIFNSYVLVVASKKYNSKDGSMEKYFSKIKKNSIIISLIASAVLYLLPIYIFNEGGLTYTYGPITNCLIVEMFILVFMWIILCIVNYKDIKHKRFIPIIACVIVLTLVLVIQSRDRSILIATTGHAFIVVLMFFTIENPDVKMIEELNKNRLLVNQINEEKSNFLFLAATQIKEPIEKIETISSIKENENNLSLKEKLVEINNQAHLLSFLVNNIMNVSTLTNSSIKVIENKYSLVNLIEKIRIIKEKEVKDGVDLRITLSKSIPKTLYGDSKLLEQVISSLLDNAIKYTNTGFIELTVNTIVKYDMCRLVITIYDSGSGISIDKVNELLLIDEPLNSEDLKRLETKNVDINTIKKIVNKLGGYFTIKSEVSKGTEIKIVIDQKIKEEGKISFDKYLNKDMVLIASNDMAFLNNVAKLVTKKGYEVETSTYANDVLDRLRLNQEFSYIFLDDMLDIRAIEIMKKLKQNPKFKTPIIVMLDKDSEFIKEHFIEDGFNDYLLKSNLASEIERILK